MKHDIPLLKSDVDFSSLAALYSFQYTKASHSLGSQTVEF